MMPELIVMIVKAIIECVPLFIQAAWELIKGLAKGIWEAIKGLWNTIKGFFNDLWDGILGIFGIGKGKSKGSELGSQIVADTCTGMQSQSSNLQSTAESVFGAAQTGADAVLGGNSFSDAGSGAVISTAHGMQSEQGMLQDTSQNVFAAGLSGAENAFGGGTATRFSGVGRTAITSAAQSMTSTQGTLTSATQSVFQAGVNTTYSTLGIGGSGGSSSVYAGCGRAIVQGATQGVTSTQSQFTNSVSDMMTSGINTAQNTIQSHSPSRVFMTIGQNICQGAVQGVSNSSNSFSSAIKTMCNNGISTATGTLGVSGGASSKFSSIGQSIVNGAESGVKSRESSFTSHIASFFNGIVSKVKNTLGIHSPSKVFKDVIGKNIALGIKVGVDAEKNGVQNSINKLVNPDKVPDYVARMKMAVSSKMTGFRDEASAFADKISGFDKAERKLTAREIAQAIWAEAPELDVDLDGEKVGAIIEPRVSRIQGTKTTTLNRRAGLATI